MKKNILIIAASFTTFAHSMEINSFLAITKNSLSILSHGTTINVIKGSIFDPIYPIDITVVGYHQQKMFQKGPHYQQTMGYIPFSPTEIVYENNTDDDSASDDDTHKPYPVSVHWPKAQIVIPDQSSSDDNLLKNSIDYYHKQKLEIYKVGRCRTIKSYVLTIAEPCISQLCEPNKEGELTQYLNFKYCARQLSNRKDVITRLECFDEDAIAQASNDLASCYKTCLSKGSYGLLRQGSKIKHIALTTLGADTGFPRELAAPIAVATVLEWVKDNLNQYESINLYVKKRSDFALYKKLLIHPCNIANKIWFLYCAHKDSELLLSDLPCELIDYIGLLMLGYRPQDD